MNAPCSHAASIRLTELPDSIAGREDCLATGGWWVHLRMCRACGKIGCCGSSPTRHASRHARAGGHPVARPAEPGEDWSWGYPGNVAFVVNGP